MTEKDRPETQEGRLRRLLSEIRPGCVMQFKQPGGSFISFRVDSENGKPLGVSGEYHSSVIADKSDDELKQIIEAVCQVKEVRSPRV